MGQVLVRYTLSCFVSHYAYRLVVDVVYRLLSVHVRYTHSIMTANVIKNYVDRQVNTANTQKNI